MLKTLVTTTFSLVLVGFIPSVGVADPRPNFTYPNTTLDDSQLFCYMQTADGRMLDLGRICGRSTPQQATELTQSPIPSIPVPGSVANDVNLNAPSSSPIPNLANSNNGDSPACFVFDAQGRPCSSPAQ